MTKLVKKTTKLTKTDKANVVDTSNVVDTTMSNTPNEIIKSPVKSIDQNTPTTENTPVVSEWDMLFAQMHEPLSDENVRHIAEETAIENNTENNSESTNKEKTSMQDFTDLNQDITTIITTKKVNVCTSCSGKLNHNGNKLICMSCGLVIDDSSGITDEQYTSTTLSDCNVSDKGFMSMKIIGRGGYGNNRSLLKSCAKYDQYRNANTRKDVHNWNSQSTDKHLPKNVIEEACNMFARIKSKNYVYRKDVKKGVLSACIYYACYNNGISKTPNEIANLVGIAEKFHSMGDRILRDLNECGVIELPEKVDPIVDYVQRYMEVLGIDKKYRDFVLDIIHIADREKLHVLSDSKNNTKCIGAIYLLIDRVPELRKTIDKEKIDNDCEISKTTFIKYYNLICKFYRKFIPVFARYSIPMKPEWKEDIYDVIKNKNCDKGADPVTKRKKYVKKAITAKTTVTTKPTTKQPAKSKVKAAKSETPVNAVDVVDNKSDDKVDDKSDVKINSNVDNKISDLFNKPIKIKTPKTLKTVKTAKISIKQNSIPSSPKSDITDLDTDIDVDASVNAPPVDSYSIIRKKFNLVRRISNRTSMPIRLK